MPVDEAQAPDIVAVQHDQDDDLEAAPTRSDGYKPLSMEEVQCSSLAIYFVPLTPFILGWRSSLTFKPIQAPLPFYAHSDGGAPARVATLPRIFLRKNALFTILHAIRCQSRRLVLGNSTCSRNPTHNSYQCKSSCQLL